uniref:Uncharacterized protein n=1 Tax=Manihot esculenta TaxID=3983 RepID=A0A2C9V8Q5_MANES
MAIHLSLRVAPLDLQQGGNSRIPYVHVPAARMSILVYNMPMNPISSSSRIHPYCSPSLTEKMFVTQYS